MHPLLSAPLPRLLAILALTLLQLSAALAAGTRKNVTVDDTNGSNTGVQIAYSPPGAWSVGQNCTACQAKLDKSQAFDGSWHDVSFISDNPPPTPISASLTFNGFGVYAFCVITRSNSDPNGNWDLSFLIDGEQAGTFKLAPDGDDTYHYNVPVYANDSLASGKHTFTMVVGHPGGQSSIALLDYMIFTQEDDAPTTTSSSISESESSSPSSAPHPSSSIRVTTTSTLPLPASLPSSHSGAPSSISNAVPTPVSTSTISVSTLTSASSVSSVLSSGVSSATSAVGPSSATNPAGGLSSAGSSPSPSASPSPSSNAALGMFKSRMGAGCVGVVGAGVALAGIILGAGLVV